MRLASLILLAAVLRLGAAEYHVAFDTGSDAAAGTSGAPWQHCPGDANATGNAASATLTAGDTVYFHSSQVYTGQVNLTFSGSSGSPIVYDGSTWPSAGRAIIDGANVANARGFTDGGSGQRFLKFTGLKIQNMGGYSEDDPIWATTTAVTSPPGGIAWSLTRAGDIEITNCAGAEIGQWQNTIPMSGTGSVTGVGVNAISVTNLLIVDSDFTRMKIGVGLYAEAGRSITGIMITNTAFHNYMNWLIDIAPTGVGSFLTDIRIARCSFYDYHHFDAGVWTGYGEKPHQDGIFVRTAAIIPSLFTNIFIENCLFHKDDTVGSGGTASIYLSQGSSATIRGNVFADDDHTAHVNVGYTKGANYQYVHIYNNTSLGTTTFIKVSHANSNPDEILLYNNLGVSKSATRNLAIFELNHDGITNLVSDYNRFGSLYSPMANHYVVYTGGYRTLANWQALGWDANTTIGDVFFVYTNGVESTWDLHLLSSSEDLLTAGTNLFSHFGAWTTRDGTVLNGSGDWPIGAYASTNEFALEPEIITATVDSTGTNWAFGANQTLFVGAGGSGGFSASLTLGAVTLTYASGSGTSTLLYSGGRTIYAGETGSLSYTQPGNGIEDSDGDDLATFSGLAVANNSSQQQPAPSGAARSLVKFKGLKVGP